MNGGGSGVGEVSPDSSEARYFCRLNFFLLQGERERKAEGERRERERDVSPVCLGLQQTAKQLKQVQAGGERSLVLTD